MPVGRRRRPAAAAGAEPPSADSLALAYTDLERAAGRMAYWATQNEHSTDAWEIRIAAAEVIDLFQQVAVKRFVTVGPDRETFDQRLISAPPSGVAPAPTSERPASKAPPAKPVTDAGSSARTTTVRATRVPVEVIDALGRAAEKLASLAKRSQPRRQKAFIDTFAKALGTVGTTLVTVAGISRIDGLFPVPRHDAGLIVGTIVSFVVGVVAVLWIALRLNRVAEPISLRSDIDDLIASHEVREHERRLLTEVYRRTYELNSARSLLAYELRGLRFSRIRSWIGDQTAIGVCQDRAAEIGADVFVTLVLSVVGFAIFSGEVTSRQTGEISTVKSCADAQAALNAATPGNTTTAATTATAHTTTTVTTVVYGSPSTNGKSPGPASLPAICHAH